MEETLSVHINFNENIVRKQLWHHFYYSWKKKLPTIFRNFLYALLVIFIFDSLIGKKTRYDFFQFALLFFGLACLFYLIHFYYQKANYSIKIDKHIDEVKGYHPITELYFDEKNFQVNSELYNIRSLWKKITYEVSDTIIMLHIDIGTIFTYLISKEETDQYTEILNFLKHKAKLKNK
ncbi:MULTISPECIES: hypothetical protein [unclassified Chryseobacterium]|uniref:hypothetical protein n=1 Tax=unclassified Chryseobacterium TaxID=2593645 RepID=UPI00100BE529|nr:MULTISPECIES: hypothetical protein [unclassified Chryseobacterium]RXM52451.1 hypothetical protein BOQ64_06135 [Chryseobacterium sp. CH25]RXM66512.1 hypothetical protein BOQ60_00615 [Chryseobacterium sp. CH1]